MVIDSGQTVLALDALDETRDLRHEVIRLLAEFLEGLSRDVEVVVSTRDVAYAVVGPDRLTYCSANTLEDCLEGWKATLPHRPAGGALIRHPWDLVERNARQLALDAQECLPGRGRPDGVGLVGPASGLVVDPTARIDPMVVREGSGGKKAR